MPFRWCERPVQNVWSVIRGVAKATALWFSLTLAAVIVAIGADMPPEWSPSTPLVLGIFAGVLAAFWIVWRGTGNGTVESLLKSIFGFW